MIAKRIFDMVVAALLLLCLAPLLALAALAVQISMGSPVLFRQLRPGLRGRPFTIYKFRTMQAATEQSKEVCSDAARLTSVGRFLRRTSIDELPELWNVLVGDMSLVGPRPLLMQYLDRYSPEQARRHDVRPGLTGLAQVSGRNALSWEEKFALDVAYVETRSMWLDLKIMARTAQQIVRPTGISAEGTATMPEFMGSTPSQMGDNDPTLPRPHQSD